MEAAARTTFDMSMGTSRQGACSSRFHSLNGDCADVNGFGKVLDMYPRVTPANYCNGRDTNRCKRNGQPLPPPRTVSLKMQTFMSSVPFNNKRTRLMADFGQFITHDMIQTPDLAHGGPDPCNCVRTDVCINIFLPSHEPEIHHFPCFFIVKSVGRLALSGTNQLVKVSFLR